MPKPQAFAASLLPMSWPGHSDPVQVGSFFLLSFIFQLLNYNLPYGSLCSKLLGYSKLDSLCTYAAREIGDKQAEQEVRIHRWKVLLRSQGNRMI